MFDKALQAGLPLITVKTDDLTTAHRVIEDISQFKPIELPSKLTSQIAGKLYVSADEERVTFETYQWAQKNERQVVFINCPAKDLAFDAGLLVPTPNLVGLLLEDLGVKPERREEVGAVLKGLSLKAAREVMLLTSVETHSIDNIPAIRRMRAALSGGHQGLYPLDTSIGFYEVPQALAQYLHTQRPYFLKPDVPPFLRPRGLMFAGQPGTGKTMAAKYIANYLGVPLYRLDIASTLSRYQGDSEGRLMHSFDLLDREEPCVVLLDEVEKIFGQADSDAKSIERMLSQLLWWLQDHVTRVLVIMTTNNLTKLPPELYRPGRIDAVITVPLLTSIEARNLSHKVLKDLVPYPTLPMLHALTQYWTPTDGHKTFVHSEVVNYVISVGKQHNWFGVS